MGALEHENGARPTKRQRSLEMDVDTEQRPAQDEGGISLMYLSDDVLHMILALLPSSSLMAMNSVCRYFRGFAASSGLHLTHHYAKEALIRMVGEKQAGRWRSYNWLQRLLIEETLTNFDIERSKKQEFMLVQAAGTASISEIKLDLPGPRMLLSDLSTADSPILRWKLQLRGNNAAEFGVVPVDMQDAPKALHKCLPNEIEERATGFSSAITVGSLLPARLPIMKGTTVEMLVTPRDVSFIVTNPKDGSEMVWQNNSTISRSYKGPHELRLELPYNYSTPVKLAVTAWQRAAFEVQQPATSMERQTSMIEQPHPATSDDQCAMSSSQTEKVQTKE